ncbi:MAG: nuclear transport factor 2 family protein [Chloroflexota bacterium]
MSRPTVTFEMQTVEQANLDLVKSLLAAFSNGNVLGIRGILTPDVKFRFPGYNALSGEFKGIDAALGLLSRIFQWNGGSTRIRLHDVLANEQHGVLLYTVTARHGDRTIRYKYMDLYHFRDGQISEVWGVAADDARAFDEFYSE